MSRFPALGAGLGLLLALFVVPSARAQEADAVEADLRRRVGNWLRARSLARLGKLDENARGHDVHELDPKRVAQLTNYFPRAYRKAAGEAWAEAALRRARFEDDHLRAESSRVLEVVIHRRAATVHYASTAVYHGIASGLTRDQAERRRSVWVRQRGRFVLARRWVGPPAGQGERAWERDRGPVRGEPLLGARPAFAGRMSATEVGLRWDALDAPPPRGKAPQPRAAREQALRQALRGQAVADVGELISIAPAHDGVQAILSVGYVRLFVRVAREQLGGRREEYLAFRPGARLLARGTIAECTPGQAPPYLCDLQLEGEEEGLAPFVP